MRIFQIVTLSELGGAQTIVANLSNMLAKEHEVIVIAGEGDGKLFELLDEKMRYIKLNSLMKKISPVNEFKVILYFFFLYMKYKPDIIHLHSSKAGTLGRLVFPKNKIVYTVHGFDSIRLAYRKYLFIEKYLQNNCKAIVAVSHYDRKNLVDENIIKNVKCIYNGVYEKNICTNIEYSIPERYKKKILCVARISRPKRFEIFLEIASLLPEYAFVWIGNNENIDNTPQNVFCLGNFPDARQYNKYVDLFVLPTDYEGLPVVIIEAMSFGKPIVASDVGGISEIVVNDENGYTVENIPIRFAKKIKYILENEYVHKKFSVNSLRRYREQLTVGSMTKNYLEIYQS